MKPLSLVQLLALLLAVLALAPTVLDGSPARSGIGVHATLDEAPAGPTSPADQTPRTMVIDTAAAGPPEIALPARDSEGTRIPWPDENGLRPGHPPRLERPPRHRS